MLDRKTLLTKIFQSLTTLTFCLFLSYLLLIDLNLNKANIWTDYSGLINLKNNLGSYFFVWTDELLGRYFFTVTNNIPFILISGLLSKFLDPVQITYYIYFVANFLALISGFFLANKITKRYYLSLLIAPLFIFNPIYIYYLYARGVITLLFTVVGFNLSLAFFYEIYVSSKKDLLHQYLPKIFLIVVSSLFVTHPFIFVFYSICMIYLFLFIAKGVKKTAIFLILLFFTHIFWLVPFGLSYIYKSHELLGSYSRELIFSYASTGLFQNSLLFIGRSEGLFHALFNNYFYVYPILFFALWGLLIYFSLVKHRSSTIAYWPLLVFLLVFSLGPRTTLGTVYKYLFLNFSPFTFFRSYQNVLIVLLCIFLYLCLISAQKSLKFHKFLGVLSFLLVLSFVLLRDTTFTQKSFSIPPDYFLIKTVVDSSESIGKTALLPVRAHDKYIWGTDNDNYFIYDFFTSSDVTYLKRTNDILRIKDVFETLYSTGDFGELGEYGFRYVLYQKDFSRGFIPFANEINLPLRLSTSYADLYEIPDYAPHILSEYVEFKKLSPVEYRTKVRISNTSQRLEMLTAFNSGWKVYINKSTSGNWCENASKTFKQNTIVECVHKSKPFYITPLESLDNELDISHYATEKNTNAWDIDKEYISKTYSDAFYITNEDGSITVDLTIYFIPQLFFNLSFLLSLVIISVMIVVSIVLRIKSKHYA